MSSFRTLNIGMTSLFTQRAALDATGQNIANAATPGYARQRVVMQSNVPQVYPYGAVGTGVDIKKIEHLTDDFLEMQVRTAKSDMDSLQVFQDGYSNIEVYFNELSDSDLSSSFNQFWNSMQDWNNNVEDISTRRNVASQAQTLCDSFQSIRQKIFDYRYQTNLAVQDTVDGVNEITVQIADLNQAIMRAEAGGATGVIANDLRDQRTELAKQLSGIMDVSVNEESNGSLLVAQKGRLLVFEDKYFELSTERESSAGMLIDNVVFKEDSEEVEFESGSLFGQVQMRDVVTYGFQSDLDQLAGEFLWNFNLQHSQGVGLAAFDSATATNTVLDPLKTLDEIEFDFTPVDGTFEIKDGSFEIKVLDASSGQETTVNIDIDLTGVEDDQKTILANTVPSEVSPGVWEIVQPETSLLRKVQDALNSVVPNTFNVELDYGNQLKITTNSDDITFSFGRDSSGALAALGFNSVFTGYDAESINVNQTYIDHPEYLAGADKFVDGDQTNAIKLLALRTKTVMSSESSTFEDYYEGIIGRLGIEGSRVNGMYTTQTDILLQVENQRENLSGVNLDEEMTKMLQFQKSYQAAAKFVTTADSLLETIINM